MDKLLRPGVEPFWSDKADALTKELWLPTRRVLRQSSKNVSGSWFLATNVKNVNTENPFDKLTNLKEFYKPEKYESNMSAKLVKMNLTKLQSRMIRSWIKGSNILYNFTIDYLRECYVKAKEAKTKMEIKSNYDFRDETIPKFPELLNIPFDIKAFAISDAYLALKSSIALSKITKRPFKLTHREEENSIGLPQASFRNGVFYNNYFSNIVKTNEKQAKLNYADEISDIKKDKTALSKEKSKVKQRKNPEIELENLAKKEAMLTEKERLLAKKLDFSQNGKINFAEKIAKIDHDYRVIHYKGIGYFITVPSKCVNNINVNTNKVVSLDPGVRTFNSYYSNESCGELGKGSARRILRIQKHNDALQDKLSKTTKVSKVKGIKKAIKKSNIKVKNLIDELHWKTASFLTKNFDKIIIPKFNVRKMTTKTKMVNGKLVKSTLHKSTKRMMLTLSHYKFRMRLVYKAKRNNSSVMFTTEEYTSQTCTCCGKLHPNLGGNKIFKCPSCNVVVDRDLNGARNIMIRTLTKKQNSDVVCTGIAGPAVV